MTIKKYKKPSYPSKLVVTLVLVVSALTTLVTVATPRPALAATAEQCRASSLTNSDYDDKGKFIGYDAYRNQCACKDSLSPDKCGIVSYLQLFINVLSGLVGVVVVIMIAVGGVQYASSRDNPQQTSAAKNRIRDAVMALVIYLFIFAFLQWLIPGGLF